MNKKIGITLTLVSAFIVGGMGCKTFAKPNPDFSTIDEKLQSMAYEQICENSKQKTITEIAASDSNLSTLVTALQTTGLDKLLSKKGPYTVFAPTNEAFKKLPKDTLENLLKPENKDKLKDILTYHVYPGKVSAEEAKKLDGKEIEMANNKKAKVEVKDGELYIDGAKVIKTDIMADNGVIHIVESVLIP